MTTTTFVLAVMIFPALLWEVYAILSGEVITISEAYMHLKEDTPFVAYALGVLAGHFSVQPPAKYTLAEHWDEATEVAVVVFIGWVVFILGRAVELPWYITLSLVVGAVLLGAFGWTIGV